MKCVHKSEPQGDWVTGYFCWRNFHVAAYRLHTWALKGEVRVQADPNRPGEIIYSISDVKKLLRERDRKNARISKRVLTNKCSK